MILLFEQYILNESLDDANFYDLFGKLIYVYDSEYKGADEYIIKYFDSTGKEGVYVDTLKEIEQDFTRSSDSFDINIERTPIKKIEPVSSGYPKSEPIKKETPKPVTKSKISKKKSSDNFDIVFLYYIL